MAESKTSPRAIAARERHHRALQLRKTGATYQQIADTIGYADKACAYRAVIEELRRIPAEDVAAVRKFELERLDQMLVGLWPKATSGDTRSVEMAIRIMERRSRLMGLDAPIRQTIEVLSESTVDTAIRELTAQLAAKEANHGLSAVAGGSTTSETPTAP